LRLFIHLYFAIPRRVICDWRSSEQKDIIEETISDFDDEILSIRENVLLSASSFTSSSSNPFLLNSSGMDHKVLTILLMSPQFSNLLHHLIWETFKNTCNSSASKFLSLMIPISSYQSSLSSCLLCFCNILQYQLKVMCDFELQPSSSSPASPRSSLFLKFLSVEILADLSHFLNTLAWELIKFRFSSQEWHSFPYFDNLHSTVTSLVRILYDRNSRLKFLKSEDWVLKEPLSYFVR
ncbi:hypothetical protein IE077_003389, partial [Cardiosporidium cionae]